MADLDGASAVLGAAARMARAVNERARFQRNQIARLRRRHFEVVGVPFMFRAELDLEAVEEIADRLAKKLLAAGFAR